MSGIVDKLSIVNIRRLLRDKREGVLYSLLGGTGTAEDYQREYKDTLFGLLVRKIAKMKYEAAVVDFSEFINAQTLSQAQFIFVKKVIQYIAQNGYIDFD